VEEAGEGERLRPGPTADTIGCLEDQDRLAGAGQDDGGGEPVGAGADDDRVRRGCGGYDLSSMKALSWFANVIAPEAAR